jgi:HlyD family secretion protein
MQHQKDLLEEEFTSKSSLLAKGIVTRSSVNALERSIAEADGDIARLQSEMLAADAQMAKFNKQIMQAKDAAQQAALDEMQNVEAEFDAIRE